MDWTIPLHDKHQELDQTVSLMVKMKQQEWLDTSKLASKRVNI